MSTAVYSVQVKRKVSESPLQALVVRGVKRKRGNTDQVVFRLAATFTEALDDDATNVMLQTAEVEAEKPERIFKMPKRSQAEPTHDEELPEQYRSILHNYLASQHAASTITASSAGKETCQNTEAAGLPAIDSETEDYVYDIYYGEHANENSLSGMPIGYIDLTVEDEYSFLFNDEDSTSNELEDFEDSNAEDYYRNDYPDEEDSTSTDSMIPEDEFDELRLRSSWSEDDKDI